MGVNCQANKHDFLLMGETFDIKQRLGCQWQQEWNAKLKKRKKKIIKTQHTKVFSLWAKNKEINQIFINIKTLLEFIQHLSDDQECLLLSFNWVEKYKSCKSYLSMTCLIKDTRLWRLSHWNRIICEVEFGRNCIRTILILHHDHTRGLCIQGTLYTKSRLNYSLLPREQ